MNKSLMFILLSLFLVSCASRKKTTIERLNYPNPFEFTLIDTLEATQSDLYVRAHEWMAKSYGSSKAVIEMQDKEAGKLIGKAIAILPRSKVKFVYDYADGGDINYTISIDARDNRYRVVISNISHNKYTYYLGSHLYTSPGYGNLSNKFVPVKDPATQTIKPSKEERYYEIKNYCMYYFTETLNSIKNYIHNNPDKF